MEPAKSDDKNNPKEGPPKSVEQSAAKPTEQVPPNTSPNAPNDVKKTEKAETQVNDKAKDSKFQKNLESFKTWASGLRWIPTSDKELQASEEKILSHLERNYKSYFVDIGEPTKESAEGKGNDKSESKGEDSKPEGYKIRTVEIEPAEAAKLPLVLVHGFNLALAVWILNLDQLAERRKVYAIDLLGFGRSSRPKFKKKELPEMDLVDALESWRKSVGLEKFDLLGHSFGGYISASYALKHGSYLNRLILLEPYGFSDKLDLMDKVPVWYKLSFKVMHQCNINPMMPMRASGPLGKLMISNKDEIRKKFEPKLKADATEMAVYLYHCNASKASGERIFKQLCTSELNIRRPILLKAGEFNPQIKLNIIYGQHSWIYKETEEDLKKRFPGNQVEYKIIDEAGHHVYSDKPFELNSYINSL